MKNIFRKSDFFSGLQALKSDRNYVRTTKAAQQRANCESHIRKALWDNIHNGSLLKPTVKWLTLLYLVDDKINAIPLIYNPAIEGVSASMVPDEVEATAGDYVTDIMTDVKVSLIEIGKDAYEDALIRSPQNYGLCLKIMDSAMRSSASNRIFLTIKNIVLSFFVVGSDAIDFYFKKLILLFKKFKS